MTIRRDAIRPMSPDEKEVLLKVLRSGRDRLILLLLLETGRPISDLREARISDLDLNKGVLRLRSQKGEEMVPLSPEITEEMRSYLGTRPNLVYLFEGSCGKPVTPRWIRCVLEPLAHWAGVRHIYASQEAHQSTKKSDHL